MKLGRVLGFAALAIACVTFAVDAQIFDTWLSYNVGLKPNSITLADMDGDGDLDVVVTNITSNSVTVLLNAGDGTFPDTTEFPSGGGPTGVAAADLDSNGTVDLVTCNSASGNFSVLKNNGSARFSPGVNCIVGIGGGGGPRSIITGDFNNDGRPDVVTANFLDSSVSVNLNQGHALFPAECKNFANTKRFPRQVIAFNFNNDGFMDLATADSGSNTVSILKNLGDGTFGLFLILNIGGAPADSFVMSVAAGDINGDGFDDLVASSLKSNTVSIFRNLGTGAFAAPLRRAVGTGSSPYRVLLRDFSGDGKLDIAALNFGTGILSIFRYTGTGLALANYPDSTRADYSLKPNPYSMEAGDLDGDNDLDIVIVQPGSGVAGAAFGRTIVVIRNNGDGSFAGGVRYATGNQPTDIAGGDFDGDGDRDLAVTNQVTSGNSVGNSVSTLRNNGSGIFAPKSDVGVPNNPSSITAADFDGDTDVDIAVSCVGNNSIRLLFNNGTGIFTLSPTQLAAGSVPRSLRSADLDGDGDFDLVSGSQNTDSIILHFNNGSGAFPVRSALQARSVNNNAIFPADLDGDGDIDLAVATRGLSNDTNTQVVSVFKNNGNGTFATRIDYRPGINPSGVTACDVDNDGDLDLIVSNEGTPTVSDNTVSVLLNDGSGNFGSHVKYPVGVNPVAITCGDFDADGFRDLVTADSADNTFSFLRNNAAGSFEPKESNGAGRSPVAIFAGDLNNDGDRDLVFVNFFSNEITVTRNLTNPALTSRPGDVDGDGVLDLVDVAMSINCTFIGLGNPYNHNQADVNCSGTLTGADVVLLVNAYFLSRALPACP